MQSVSSMHALILANGEQPPFDLLCSLRAQCDLFVATDGAANSLARHNILPDFVLGDMDSIHSTVLQDLPLDVLQPVADQEASDLDKAIAFANEKGASQVTVLGAGGGRFDHAFTAASLLLKYDPSVEISLRSEHETVRVARATCEIEGTPGDILSLVFFAPAEGVSLDGVEWPLREETLLPGSRGVSNRLVEDRARLTIRSGWALLCHLFAQR
jgi:thiamine pyrophosphokinase